MALIQTLKRHALLTYFVLVFVLTWAFWIPLALIHPFSPVLLLLGNIMPSLVGIGLTALFSGKSGLGELFRRLGRVRVPLIWYAVVRLLVPVLQLVAIGIPTLLGLATIAFAFPVVGVLDSFYAGLGEELGWRGFALPRMQARQQALPASLLLGFLWGLWHLPYNIALGVPLASIFIGAVLGTPALAVLFTWVYNNTKGSLFLMVLFHVVIDIVGYTILASNGIGSVLYLILQWVAVTIVVVRAGAARLSRSSNVAPA
jgi:membrane protease YdiL (CAAX protease family)